MKNEEADFYSETPTTLYVCRKCEVGTIRISVTSLSSLTSSFCIHFISDFSFWQNIFHEKHSIK